MDIEAIVAKRLMGATGIKAFLTVPDNAPTEFMVVTLTGMSGTRFNRFCSVELTVWGKDEHDRKRAYELARLLMEKAPSLDEEQNIFNPEATNCYRSYDQDTGRACYTVQLELSICE